MKGPLFSAGLFFLVCLTIFACGGGGNQPSTGTVALFATDDISDYKQVTATINNVKLIHTGSGRSCEVLAGPENIDIANLSDVLQLIDVKNCEAGPYNRIHLNFAKSVSLMDAGDVMGTCEFVSYKDKDSPGRNPKILQCGADNCTMDINGAVNVLASRYNKVALDFDLKEFEVMNFPDPACTVTMKVSPLNASGMDDKKRTGGYSECISGFVSDLDAENDTFTLTRGKLRLEVDYSGASYGGEAQPGIDSLLTFAQDKRLKVKVKAESIDISGGGVTASTVLVKAEGAVSDLDMINNTFTLSNQYKSFNIGVDYDRAAKGGRVEGDISQPDVQVETKLFGYADPWYLAHEVEVDDINMDTDD